LPQADLGTDIFVPRILSHFCLKLFFGKLELGVSHHDHFLVMPQTAADSTVLSICCVDRLNPQPEADI
jgi:hypothetical protein